jgi:DNA-directed RNA polymerase specialized sigma24 family protein
MPVELDPEERVALETLKLKGQSDAEIARALGVTEGRSDTAAAAPRRRPGTAARTSPTSASAHTGDRHRGRSR